MDYRTALEVFERETEQNKSSALFDLYKSDVKTVRGPKTLMESIRIKGPRPFYYDMLFITRETRSKTPWFKAVMDLKEKIESENGKSVEIMSEIIYGSQSKLTDY